MLTHHRPILPDCRPKFESPLSSSQQKGGISNPLRVMAVAYPDEGVDAACCLAVSWGTRQDACR